MNTAPRRAATALLTLVLGGLVVVLEPAGPAPAVTSAPAPGTVAVDDLEVLPDTDTSLRLCAVVEDADPLRYDVRVAAGTEPPGDAVPPTATLPGPAGCGTVAGLVPGAPYTFDVRAVTVDGAGPAYVTTAATRTPGVYVGSADGVTRVLPEGYDEAALAVGRSGRQHLVAPTRIPGKHSLGIGYLTRARGGAWSAPVVLAQEDLWDQRAFVSANRRGAVLVAWNNAVRGVSYRLRPAGTTRWGAVQRLNRRPSNDLLVGAVLDARDKVHVLVNHPTRAGGDVLHYRTNGSGRWTDTVVTRRTCRTYLPHDDCVNALLTYDDVADRVVVVEQHTRRRSTGFGTFPFSELRVAAVRSTAKAFPQLRLVRLMRADRAHMLPSSVSARGGRVLVTVRGALPEGSNASPRSGIYLVSGTITGAWRQRFLEVTAGQDVGEALAVWTRDREVALVWRRTADWDPTRQGVWQAVARHLREGVWRWALSAQRQVSSSPYDRLRGLGADGGGLVTVSLVRR